jgi:hypothetical protein
MKFCCANSFDIRLLARQATCPYMAMIVQNCKALHPKALHGRSHASPSMCKADTLYIKLGTADLGGESCLDAAGGGPDRDSLAPFMQA